MPKPGEWDVLVVGAGPAGARAAEVASAAGCATLLIDAKTQIGGRPHCGEAVPAELFHRFNVDSVCVIQAIESCQMLAMELPADESPDLGMPHGDRDRGHPTRSLSAIRGSIVQRREGKVRLLMTDRARFDRDLARAAAAAGATVLAGTRLVRREGDEWIIRRPEGETALRPRYVVGADGAISKVAAQIGQDRMQLGHGLQIEVPLAQPSTMISIFLSRDLYGGYGWLFPKGVVANLGVGAMPGTSKNLRNALAGLATWAQHAGLIHAGRLATYAGVIPSSGIRSTIVAENVVLCGDAAGLTHPLTGGGIAPAFISGHHAGIAVSQALASGRREPLVEYDRTIRSMYGKVHQSALAKRDRMLAQWDSPDLPQVLMHEWAETFRL